MNPIAEIRKRQAERRAELEKLNYTFSPVVSFEDLSAGEMRDLAELEVGESTYIGDYGDVTRVK